MTKEENGTWAARLDTELNTHSVDLIVAQDVESAEIFFGEDKDTAVESFTAGENGTVGCAGGAGVPAPQMAMGLARINTTQRVTSDQRPGLNDADPDIHHTPYPFPHPAFFPLYQGAFGQGSNVLFYFGGVNGVNFFNPENIVPNTNTPLAIITGLKVGDKNVGIDEALSEDRVISLGTKENYLQIFFKAMRYAVPEKIRFYYKLEGLEQEWNETSNEDFVRYNNLVPGNYTFLIRACNEDNFCDEEVQRLAFTIAAPFYKTLWFVFLMAFLFLLTVFGIYRFRANNLRKAYAAKMTNVELRALRIQMNPHFIFNSLNSIQYYVLNADSKTAYKYLTKFSSLMRRTLQHSKENFLPLKEELESLKIYLELENLRLENSLNIQIDLDKTIDLQRTLIPTLFLQPFVENAIIHGLLPKEGEKNIRIKIDKHKQGIKCSIEDNGIGRVESTELNKKRNRSHQSTALKAIENRIDILNASASISIHMEIEDLYDGNKASGTRVILIIA